MNNIITAILTLLLVGTRPAVQLPSAINIAQTKQEQVMGSSQISLEKRHSVKSVSDVMKKNILLNLAYLSGDVKNKSDINWDKLMTKTTYSFTLRPGEVFAFHDSVLPEFDGKVVKTTNAHFNSREGFISDGYLVGDGVCHFASIIYRAAKEAGLDAIRTKSHSIAVIPEVPDEFGVSIYVNPTSGYGARNNLYVTNNMDHDVEFRFEYSENGDLKVSVIGEHGTA